MAWAERLRAFQEAGGEVILIPSLAAEVMEGSPPYVLIHAGGLAPGRLLEVIEIASQRIARVHYQAAVFGINREDYVGPDVKCFLNRAGPCGVATCVCLQVLYRENRNLYGVKDPFFCDH